MDLRGGFVVVGGNECSLFLLVGASRAGWHSVDLRNSRFGLVSIGRLAQSGFFAPCSSHRVVSWINPTGNGRYQSNVADWSGWSPGGQSGR